MALRRPDLLYVRNFVRHSDAAVAQLRPRVDLVMANGFSLRAPHDVNVSHFVHAAWAQSPVHVSKLRRGPYAWYHRAYAAANSRWERQSYSAARAVVAVSQKVRDELLSIGVPDRRLSVIVNGVDPEEFHPGPHDRPPHDRTALGLPPNVPLALFVGDIRTPRKNLDSVLHALAALPDVHLAVVGDHAKSPFPALARRLGLSPRAHFLGFRKDVPHIARAADCFVFPSRYEACSLAILEALASGLPVLTAKTAGGSELVTPDCGVVLDNPDDLTALTHSMRALLQPGPDSDRRRQHARLVGQSHSWAAMAHNYLTLFQSLLSTPAPVAKVA
jgi:glycosyltransferase involved in cell wall biosynthesis